MRIFQVLLFLMLISGCVQHQKLEGLDVASIEKSSLELLTRYPQNIVLNLEDLQTSLLVLNPQAVRIDETGIYISLEKLFVEESGLFIPRLGYSPDLSMGLDPSFKLLKSRTYSYLVKG